MHFSGQPFFAPSFWKKTSIAGKDCPSFGANGAWEVNYIFPHSQPKCKRNLKRKRRGTTSNGLKTANNATVKDFEYEPLVALVTAYEAIFIEIDLEKGW